MKTVLIVEDVELNRDLLRSSSRTTIGWCSRRTAWPRSSARAETRPDLILMDLSLPRMDGWEATRRLKADRALAHIPVIALSAHAMRATRSGRARAAATTS